MLGLTRLILRRNMATEITVGASLPNVTVTTYDASVPVAANACPVPQRVPLHSLLEGKRVVLFAVPGAFTPTCHLQHLPGFSNNLAQFKAKGVDLVACTAVHDIYVMEAWAKANGVKDIKMLADGSAELAKAIGLSFDLTAAGMGIRSKRYAMIIQDKVVKYVGVDLKGLEQSTAEAVLAHL